MKTLTNGIRYFYVERVVGGSPKNTIFLGTLILHGEANIEVESTSTNQTYSLKSQMLLMVNSG